MPLSYSLLGEESNYSRNHKRQVWGWRLAVGISRKYLLLVWLDFGVGEANWLSKHFYLPHSGLIRGLDLPEHVIARLGGGGKSTGLRGGIWTQAWPVRMVHGRLSTPFGRTNPSFSWGHHSVWLQPGFVSRHPSDLQKWNSSGRKEGIKQPLVRGQDSCPLSFNPGNHYHLS